MNLEVIKNVKKMNLDNVETQLVLQCAPLIAGLKISNLLIIQKDNINDLIEILKSTDICCRILLETAEKTTILLYKKDSLECYLSQVNVKRFLKSMNYKRYDLNEILSVFSVRYQQYMDDKELFPHEMGVLLGYPLEDVEGFVKNDGKNYMYTGYWKVYDNLSEKIRLFRKFTQVKETMIRLFTYGIGIKDIMNIYSEERSHKIAG